MVILAFLIALVTIQTAFLLPAWRSKERVAFTIATPAYRDALGRLRPLATYSFVRHSAFKMWGRNQVRVSLRPESIPGRWRRFRERVWAPTWLFDNADDAAQVAEHVSHYTGLPIRRFLEGKEIG
jgi:hypothetical protein